MTNECGRSRTGAESSIATQSSSSTSYESWAESRRPAIQLAHAGHTIQSRHRSDEDGVPINTRLVAQVLVSEIIPKNPKGFTFCPRRRRDALAGRKLNVHIHVVSLDGFQCEFQEVPSEGSLIEWIELARACLDCPGYYIGGWKQGEIFVLDVSVIVCRRDRALSFGKRNCQHSIYHPSTGEEVAVI